MKKSVYSLKVLELVAKEVSGFFTGVEIVKILEAFGMAREIIQYPNTKWWTINEAFKYIKEKYENPDDAISKLIMDFLHPLNHNLNMDTAERLSKKVEEYLRYDNFYIENTGKEYLVFSDEEMEEMHTPDPSWEEETEKEKLNDEKKIKQNKDLIKNIRDTHQKYIDIIELFCRNPKKPTKELNDAYVFLVKKLEKDLQSIDFKYSKIILYKPFRKDLYSAEAQWNGTSSMDFIIGPKLSWDEIRPSLYKVHSDITNLCNIADDFAEMTDEEKKLEEITNLISQQRNQSITTQKDTVKKMEILHKYEKTEKFSKSLSDCVISFDDPTATIHIDSFEIPLPEYGKEHYLTRTMFKRKKNEGVDWSIVYNEMQSTKGLPDKEKWRYVYDACNDINKRIKEILNTKEKLFDWSEKTIKRLH